MNGDALFESSTTDREPLAARMRPRTIDEFVGQSHIVGPGRLLRRAIQADQISSLIFAGPPGTGKTTLARVIANTTKSAFLSINAVLAGVKEIRAAIDEAQRLRSLYGRKTILFVDEVHRWNKSQQDALLPWVENGTLCLIGATTENPFFEVNPALLSRSRVFRLVPLTDADLAAVATAALRDPERGYGRSAVSIAPDALEHLIRTANGDARTLLNALELAVETTPTSDPTAAETPIVIDRRVAEESIQQKAVLYDKEGDYHYDTISAFIKSVRGSDPDAALFWLAKMVQAGEYPRFIFRRLLILAAEDVGLADPQALTVVESAAAAFDRVGMPEGQFFLSQAVLYLATTAKSNSALAYFDALAAVEAERDNAVPDHLKDAGRDGPALGHGRDYRYPHAYTDHWVAQAYLPPALAGHFFYHPSDQGYEQRVAERVHTRREAQLAAGVVADRADGEVLSVSPRDPATERWLRRADDATGEHRLAVRTAVFESLQVRSHEIGCIVGDSGLIHLWEGLRRCREGQVFAMFTTAATRDIAAGYAQHLPQLQRPLLIDPCADGEPAKAIDPAVFDRLPAVPEWAILDDVLSAVDRPQGLMERLLTACKTTRLVFVDRVPGHGSRLSEFVAAADLRAFTAPLQRAETRALHDTGYPQRQWHPDAAVALVAAVDGSRSVDGSVVETTGLRTITGADLQSWLGPVGSRARPGSLGAYLTEELTADELDRFRRLVIDSIGDTAVTWRYATALTRVGVAPAGSLDKSSPS